MDEFDFIKGFAGVDVLQAEAVAAVIGRVATELFKGMVESGLPENDAHKIIRGALAAMAESLRPAS